MNFGKRKIVVWGEEVTIDVDVDLPIADVSQDFVRIGSLLAYWASVRETAFREAKQTDAEYRAWRAKKTLAILADDPKLSEYKVKATIEADPKFLKYKNAHAACEEAAGIAGGVFVALDKKANALQSKGAMMRSTLHGEDLSTPEEPRSAPQRATSVEDDEDQPASVPEPRSEEQRQAKVRAALKKTKTKKASTK